MTKVRVSTTHTVDPVKDMTPKDTDLTLPGNRRWLMSHIRWAAKFGYQVTVTPA